jgi:hypothetical protein
MLNSTVLYQVHFAEGALATSYDAAMVFLGGERVASIGFWAPPCVHGR